MTNARRLAAVVLMILSQVAGGLVVVCDEGLGGQIMEFLPQLCCESPEDESPVEPTGEQQQEPCGPCFDTPLTLLAQVEDELQGSALFELTFVATLEHTPLTQLLGCGDASARDLVSRAALSTTVSQLAGSVVLLC